jgi:peptide/nickel transport system permease protein
VRPLSAWALTWRRLRRDRTAVASLVFLALLVLLVWVGTPVASALVGHGPNDPFPYAVDPITLEGVGPWTWVPDTHAYAGDLAPPPEGGPKALMVLGSDGQLGRDLMLRLMDGGKVTLTVALGGTLLAMLIGLGLGLLAAWQGGIVDAGVGRLTEFVMAFPLLFFAILAVSTFGDRIDGITLGVLRPGVLSFILIIGLFTWFYPARIVRTEAQALRNQEFVEAARMIGASDWRILRSHLLPHLAPTLIVLTTLLVATNILLEAGLTYLGFGIELPTASWGSILSTTWGAGRSASASASLNVDPWLTIFPSLVIFGTVLALNLVGDGLRAAFDPDGGRP